MSHGRYKDPSDDQVLISRTRQATREQLAQVTAPTAKPHNAASQRDPSTSRPRTVTTLYTPGEDSNSGLRHEYDAETDEAESCTDEETGSYYNNEEHHEPVYDGEVLQEENTLLKKELAELRNRLNRTKTELAFQQSRRTMDYDEAYFEERVNGLRSQIRSWCVSYFANGRSYWTVPAERRFKPLCNEWATYLSSRSRRPWLIQARVWYILDQSLFNSASEKHSSWLYLGHKNSPSIDRMFAEAAEQSSPGIRHSHREWRALTFSLLFPGKGQYVEPNSWLQAELEYRLRRLFKLLWSSLRTYMNNPIPRDYVAEAKVSLQEITSAALYLHLDMMKYTAGLSFISEDCSTGARFIEAHMEEILGGSPQENVRLLVSPPLYKETSYDGKDTTRQVLMRAHVLTSVLERQAQTPVERTIAPIYTTRSKRAEVDVRHGHDQGSRRRKVKRRSE